MYQNGTRLINKVAVIGNVGLAKRRIFKFILLIFLFYIFCPGTSIIGSTQKPWLLNPAIIKKFEKRIHIQLPDAQARTNIFKMEIGNAPHSLTEEDLR